jgi:hypothetical protein
MSRDNNLLLGNKLPNFRDRPQQITFASYSEYAAGVLLEKYVPGYELKMGLTFQVPIGHNKTCDFLVNGVFVEYHPCNISHEFDDRQALRKFFTALKHIKAPFRDQIISSISDELSEKYYRRRKFLISMHGGKDSELIVSKNSSDLYHDVIKRFSTSAPKKEDFIREFKKLSGERTTVF